MSKVGCYFEQPIVTYAFTSGELTCSAGGRYSIKSVFTIEGLPLVNNNYSSVASIKAVRLQLPIYVKWKLIDWKEVDSKLALLPRLKVIVIVIPWLVGDHVNPQWSIENQLGVSWPLDDGPENWDAFGDVTQAVRGYFPFTDKLCNLQIVYKAQRFHQSEYT